MYDLEIDCKGKPAAGIAAGLKHSDWRDRDRGCTIFIDARDPARFVTFRVFRSRRVTLHDLLLAIVFYDTDDLVLHVEGFEFIDEVTNAFVFTVAVVWCETKSLDAPLDHPQGEEDGMERFSEDHDDHDDDSEPLPPPGQERPSATGDRPAGLAVDRSRSPRRDHQPDVAGYFEGAAVVDEMRLTPKGRECIDVASDILSAARPTLGQMIRMLLT